MDGDAPRGPLDRDWKMATELIERSERALVEHAARFSLCREDAEDAYQRAVEKLLTRAPRMSRHQMQRWIRTVVRNEALTIRRQRKRLLNVPEGAGPRAEAFGELDWVSLLPSGEPGTEATVELRERLDRAHEALGRVKRDERRALALLGKGYTYAEIQELTGWTYTKVNRCLTEGRKRFRQVFASSEQGELCDGFTEAISRFCDGELSDSREREDLEGHLRVCSPCRATLATFRAGPKAAAAALPVAPLEGLTARAQEAFAMLQSRLPGRTGASDVALAPMLTGGGARGGGMALLAKVAVICAGAGGGAAACVATGAVSLPTTSTEQAAPPIEAVVPESDGGEEVALDVEPPTVIVPEEGLADHEPADEAALEQAPAVPAPSPVEAEFGPEAAGTPAVPARSEPPAPATGATVSTAPAESTAPAGGSTGRSSDPGGLPPVGGGGEFGP